MGEWSSKFQFPDGKYKWGSEHFPTSRDIAVPDKYVDKQYWRKDDTTREPQQDRPIRVGELRTLARSGAGMGPVNNPHPVSSWDSLGRGPTALGGAIRRPKLDWQDHGNNPVGPTRIDVPVEVPRAMSMPRDTIEFYGQVSKSVKFIKRNCNNGVAMRICYAIDEAVMKQIKGWLHQCIQHPSLITQPEGKNDSTVGQIILAACSRVGDRTSQLSRLQSHFKDGSTTMNSYEYDHFSMANLTQIDKRYMPRSAQVDTGANRSLLFRSAEKYMDEKTDSKLMIQVADKANTMSGAKDGLLRVMVLSPENPDVKPQEMCWEVTTATNIFRELYSVDDLYASQKFNILLKQPDFEDGIPQAYKPATDTEPEIKIPFRYDYSEGGFWIDYLPSTAIQFKSSAQYLHAYRDSMDDYQDMQQFSPIDAATEAQRMWSSAMVTKMFMSSHLDEREL